ncbi:MAG: serine/threonine protein kinase [Pseudomonadota bacterium]|nr:serine/threonine protein kinase [Pseudomonadota bacterium]
MAGRLAADRPDVADELRALLDDHAASAEARFLTAGTDSPLAGVDLETASLAGQRLGAYTLETPIGQGGMGSVWLGQRSDGRFAGKVAVKLLNASLIGRAGGERFKREGKILAQLAHPHIARLIDAGVSGAGQPYLVLEYVEGEPIDRYCDLAGLAVDARIRLLLDVLAAVSHSHAHLIVHRDIKPLNVLVDTDGNVNLLDFGIAKLLEDGELSADATELTRDGGGALSPDYAAPITSATDVYALGVLLYVLLGGRHPTGENVRSTADLIRTAVEIRRRAFRIRWRRPARCRLRPSPTTPSAAPALRKSSSGCCRETSITSSPRR